MIGIVVVSHSRALAEAAVGLATEMVDASEVPAIAIAAGLDDTTFGTDAAAVAEAIGEVDGPDGVLVLLDLGSAVLSAEMALEFVEPETAARVTVSSAPLVEGLVAAVVLASTGAQLDAVDAEAKRGLLGKQEHLDDTSDRRAAESAPTPTGPDTSVEVEVTNAHGLHARPAAKLVSLVCSFDADVTLTNLSTGRGPVDAASLSLVATLNARRGNRLRVGASGPQREEVLTAIKGLAERAFDDRPGPEAPARPTSDGHHGGSGLDVAIGPAVVPELEIDTSDYAQGSAELELQRSRDSVATASRQLEGIRGAGTLSPDDAEIFDAHLALLADRVIRAGIDDAIRDGASAVEAWAASLDALAVEFEELDDPYQRERVQDVRSIRRRILSALMGVDGASLDAQVDAAGILVVPELDAATAATLNGSLVAGVATVRGGATGHGVIVARSRGIPIITDVGQQAAGLVSGQLVAFDAAAKVFVVDPDEATQASFRRAIADRSSTRRLQLAAAFEPAATSDGQRIVVAANIVSVADAVAAAAQGAEGSGLVRTEVLFGHLTELPAVGEQAEQFLAIARALNGQPITIRTWDVGGDKPLAFLPQPHEANPFLGERGIRLSRRDPTALREQLAAVCVAARQTPVRVMFPMISTAEEVDWALGELRDVAARGGGMPSSLQVGIMIEVPASALRVNQLAAALDFVSIGTNDLTQYLLAAERGNGAVAALADALDPAVLALIARVCDEVPAHVEVAVCGDLASNPAAAALLVGLGVRELSAVGPAVPAIKGAIRGTTLAAAQTLSRSATSADSAAAVRLLLGGDQGHILK